MRHELKFGLDTAQYLLLKNRLALLLPRDGHADAQGEYRVRSLYFDTPDGQALREKLDGTDFREKFRLRMYGGDTRLIRLEKKAKQNGLGRKTSAALTREQTERLLRGDTAWLAGGGDALLAEFLSHLRGKPLAPRTVVEYTREAFTYPAGNVRVTLDRDIRTGLAGTRFLDPTLPLLPIREGFAVLEVKFDSFLPDHIARLVRLPGIRQTAYSKYALCRKFD